MIARGSNPTIEKGAVESRTDSLIKEDIEDQLRADTRVSNYDVDVTVENGVVTLMGKCLLTGLKILQAIMPGRSGV